MLYQRIGLCDVIVVVVGDYLTLTLWVLVRRIFHSVEFIDPPAVTLPRVNPNFSAEVIVEAEAEARVNISVGQSDAPAVGVVRDDDAASIDSDVVVAEVVVEAGVIACHVCSSLASNRANKPDDTDSFTPRVRSDKRSITVLLGKGFESLPVFVRFVEQLQPTLAFDHQPHRRVEQQLGENRVLDIIAPYSPKAQT